MLVMLNQRWFNAMCLLGWYLNFGLILGVLDLQIYVLGLKKSPKLPCTCPCNATLACTELKNVPQKEHSQTASQDREPTEQKWYLIPKHTKHTQGKQILKINQDCSTLDTSYDVKTILNQLTNQPKNYINIITLMIQHWNNIGWHQLRDYARNPFISNHTQCCFKIWTWKSFLTELLVNICLILLLY